MAVKARAQITLSCVIDVQATYRYYLLQSSTLAKPSKPTVNPPTGSWNDAEPTYTAGSTNSLYFVDLTVFSDGTFAYSSVSLSSSYEAAKEAYNKAQAAQDTAQNAKDAIDNLEVSGRNLVIGTSGEWKSGNVTDITNSCHATFMLEDMNNKGLQAGDILQVSLDLKFSEDFAATGTGANSAYLQGTKNQGGTWAAISITGGKAESAIQSIIESESKEGHINTYIKVTADMIDGTYTGAWRLNIRFNYYKGTVYWRNQMVSKGNIEQMWTPAPEDIDAAISNAQTTADGKNSIFYQDTAPSTTGRKEYDIWFDTANGNKMYYFNGIAWTEKQFGTDAIADSTIVARLIASNTITGDKLVADSITAREIAAKTITANEIAANAITSAEIATGAVTADKISVTDLYAIGATIGGFSITSTKLYAGTAAGNMIAMQTGGTWAFAAGATSHSSYADAAFRVSHEGALYATKGGIGGWTLSDTGIYQSSAITTGIASTQYQVQLYSPATIASTTVALYVRQRDYDGAAYGSWTNNFYVRYDGYMYASKGKIGDLMLQSGYLRAQNTDATQYLTFRGVQSTATSPILYFGDKTSGSTVYPWRFNGDGSFKIGSLESMTGTGGANTAVHVTDVLVVDSGLELLADNIGGTPFIDFHYGEKYSTMTKDYTSRIYAGTAARLCIKPSYNYTSEVQILNEVSGEYRLVLRSDTNGTGFLGTTSYRWNTAFFTNAITASDRKLKNVLGDIDEAVDFVMSLKPYRYTFKDGDSGRVHMGLIAQDVAQTAKDLKMGDLALYQAAVVNEDGTESYYDESVPDEKLSWGLNYNELIAPLVAMIQAQEKRIQKLEQRITISL